MDKIENYNPPLEVQFFDRNNNLIYAISNEKRVYVKIDKIPSCTINAFLSAEDKTFFENPGVDILGTFKILILDIGKVIKGEKLAGASTITQQLARNLFLSNDRDNVFKLILRKAKEMTLAYKITKVFDKKKILEIYLNQISFGNNAFGIGAAAEVYFDKKTSDLNLEDSAMLASLPKGPSYFNPYKYYDRAKSRRNWILETMLKNNFITKDEYLKAKSSEIELNFERNKNQTARNACWFAKDLAINYLISENIIQDSGEFLNNGFKIKLTIDSQIQKISQKAFDDHLLYLERDKNEYRPLNSSIKFQNKEDFIKNWHSKLKKIPNEFREYLDLAFVLEVGQENVLIGLKNGSLGIIPIEKMLWAKKQYKKYQCDEILREQDLIYVKQEEKITNLGTFEDIFKKYKVLEKKYFALEGHFVYFYSLAQIPYFNGGAVITNPKNGEILSLIGGFVDIPGAFNRATSGNRQIGSTIKPFIYSVGLDKASLKPSDIFMDSDLNFDLGNGVTWNPRNHDRTNRGPLTLRSGIENSRNTVTIRVMEKTGISKVVHFLEQLQFSDKKIESNYSIGIGSVEGSPLSVARAYSMFVNDGVVKNLTIISSIKDKNNQELLREPILLDGRTFVPKKNKPSEIIEKDKEAKEEGGHKENAEQKAPEGQGDKDAQLKENLQNQDEIEISNNSITDKTNTLNSQKNEPEKVLISPQTAYQMYSFLEGAIKRGGSIGLSELKLPIGAKTGTSDKGRDLWTVAIGESLCIAVYTGYDIPQDTDMYGVKGAFPIVKNILKQIKSFYTFTTKIPPDGLKFVKIDLSNGKRTKKPIGRNVIYEIFKKEDDTDEILEDKEDGNDDILNDF